MRVQDEEEAYSTLLRLVPDGKKEAVARRLELFRVLLNSELFKYEDFKRGYEKVLHVLLRFNLEAGPRRVRSPFPHFCSRQDDC